MNDLVTPSGEETDCSQVRQQTDANTKSSNAPPRAGETTWLLPVSGIRQPAAASLLTREEESETGELRTRLTR